jgi:uncharacterized membrane protein SpoIIM required for sporulation
MIIDLPKFIATEQPYWRELEQWLQQLEAAPGAPMDIARARRFHYLYERAAADLARLNTFASEPETRRFLETLVAQAYSEVHETRAQPHRFRPWHWLTVVFPRTFRRQAGAFWLAVAVTIAGAAFGGLALALDPDAKPVLLPYAHLQMDPRERVAREEKAKTDRLEGGKAEFSAFLMTHNTRVSLSTMALGMTWAVGTLIMLFYNGVILGAVAVDYIRTGETPFLVGWLLPHGSFEIPAILIAGQAGLILGRAMIGRGTRETMAERLRAVSGDLTTLFFGVALMLVWAGFVESFFSQYHEPVIPYALKICFGGVELTALSLFLWKSGSGPDQPSEPEDGA